MKIIRGEGCLEKRGKVVRVFALFTEGSAVLWGRGVSLSKGKGP